ncbi:hypothetical protein [Streptomyces noursei]|uniref:hypothetical protein n=1 Tax=Streptomyces noursei TaxID=1971 RepID=UPI0035ABA1C8
MTLAQWAYAAAEVPVYFIADPYAGRSRVFTHPQDGAYKRDLTDTVLGITLPTDEFPRD